MIWFHIFDNYLTILLISLNTMLITAEYPELKLVNVVFRHGDRTPEKNEMFPYDPYVNFSFYPTGLGQLTAEGKKREYTLGKFLRFRYNDFLGNLYTPKLVVGRSTDFDRTKMSLQLVLAGLFPPKSLQRWHTSLNWQPITTSYIPRVDDNLFLADECPQFLEEYNRILNSPEGREKLDQFKDLMNDLTKLTGMRVETIDDLFSLYQTFLSESSMGLLLPEWAYSYFPYGPLLDGMVAVYNINNFTPLSMRLNAGPMVRDITDNMIAAQNPIAAPNTKMYLYSGHETNVANMLHALGVYKPHVPEYSSAVILELQRIGENYYVKILYYQGIPPSLKELKIPGCDILCPFDQYLEFIEDVIPSDEEMFCDKRQTPRFVHEEYPAGLQHIIYNLIKKSKIEGSITQRGKMREYELGQVLRDRYNNFLGDLYLPKLVMDHSSDCDRTKMSLQLVLAAIFPPINARQQWNPVLNWQPISTTCLEEYDRVLSLPKTQKIIFQFKNLTSELTKLTGKKIETPWDLFYLYQTFAAESSMNLTLPEWAYNYFPNGQLYDAVIVAYNIFNFTPLLKKLHAEWHYIFRLSASNMLSFRVFANYLPIILTIGLNSLLVTGAKYELKLINVVFRHGDRTPDNNEMYPNDPHLNCSFFPEGLGQLTNRGKMREYELGQVLRDRYNNFLGDFYLPKLVMGQSSDYDRTKMSLQLVLAGLFPPINAQQQWNPVLNWQPIPTTYVSRLDDNFFLSDECPQFLNEYDRVLSLPKTQKIMSQFKNLTSELTKLTGKKIEKPLDLYSLYHTFVAESSMNLTLPEWAHNYFPDGQLFDGIVAAYNIANSTPLLKRLYAGPIIRAILKNMQTAKKSNQSNTKIYLYGGHETNIASLLHAFNVFKPHVPEYSSAIILELLQQNEEYYVKLLSYRGIPPIIDELIIQGCELYCPFNKFLDLTQDLIPSDKELICDKRQTSDYANTPYLVSVEGTMYNLIVR
ncbi:LOW QUALITY PROTEIN: uncharacterized protein LOC105431612 [Pogonomyrmex barbatus]|uniref:acid phosphatase n=1 Tax=Pogonomyrmex barbatus TaxID=144034 RepID=A0A8N1SB62_9HYME|nr:LOW QUALITY PROTEIN: uncharacterized protein LOC105431612 [Pogonomyrmex barbatus]